MGGVALVCTPDLVYGSQLGVGTRVHCCVLDAAAEQSHLPAWSHALCNDMCMEPSHPAHGAPRGSGSTVMAVLVATALGSAVAINPAFAPLLPGSPAGWMV